MRKILMTATILTLAGAFILMAADNPAVKGAGEKGGLGLGIKRAPGEMGLGHYSRLNLTEEQKAKIKEIQKSRREQLSALKQDTTLTAEQRREKARAIFESTQKQIDEILTPEQRQQLEQLRAEMKEKMKSAWKKKHGEKPSEVAK
ncbi:MAG: hypothetical protein N2115_04305 [bacterium]|nr:hypothetical protein [bacterium]